MTPIKRVWLVISKAGKILAVYTRKEDAHSLRMCVKGSTLARGVASVAK